MELHQWGGHGGTTGQRWAGLGYESGGATSIAVPPRELRGEGPEGLDYQRLETVLVVEDDAELNRVFSRRLERAGLCVISALDGPHALECCRRIDPDVIVLDLGLPGLDGVKLLHTLRHTAGPTPPVLVVTGRAEVGLDQRLAPMGVRRVLHKPFSLKRLVGEVVDAIEGL